MAVVQMASGPQIQANLSEAERLIQEAVDKSAQLVVLPENFSFIGFKEADNLQVKEKPGDGLVQNFLSQQASRHGIWLVGGTVFLEAQEKNKIRSACLVFNDKGEQVARYDKIHLFDVSFVDTGEQYHESETIESGNDTAVVDTPFGRLGIAVCYDLRFPELFRALLDKGMEILALPACFTAITGKAHWEVLLRARAIENLSYVLAAGQGGYHVSGRTTYGHSMVVDPWGNILGQLPQNTGIVTANCDHQILSKTRTHFPAINHRHLTCHF